MAALERETLRGSGRFALRAHGIIVLLEIALFNEGCQPEKE